MGKVRGNPMLEDHEEEEPGNADHGKRLDESVDSIVLRVNCCPDRVYMIASYISPKINCVML